MPPPTPVRVIETVCRLYGLTPEQIFAHNSSGVLERGSDDCLSHARAACAKVMRELCSMSYPAIAKNLRMRCHSAARASVDNGNLRACDIAARAVLELRNGHGPKAERDNLRGGVCFWHGAGNDPGQAQESEASGRAWRLLLADAATIGDADIRDSVGDEPRPLDGGFLAEAQARRGTGVTGGVVSGPGITPAHIGAAVCKESGIDPGLMYQRDRAGNLCRILSVLRSRCALVWLLTNRTEMVRQEIADYMEMTRDAVGRAVTQCENDPVTMRLAEDAWARVERYKAKQRGVA